MKQDPGWYHFNCNCLNVGHTASRGMDGWEMELKVEFLKLLINFFPISALSTGVGFPSVSESHTGIITCVLTVVSFLVDCLLLLSIVKTMPMSLLSPLSLPCLRRISWTLHTAPDWLSKLVTSLALSTKSFKHGFTFFSMPPLNLKFQSHLSFQNLVGLQMFFSF